MANMVYTAFSGGSGVYRNRKTDFVAAYYKKKEMDDRYPAGGFTVSGQIGCGRDELGAVTSGGIEERVYAVSKMPHTKIVGYICVGENEYLAVLKDQLALILLLILLLALLLAGLGFLIHHAVTTGAEPEPPSQSAGVLDPDAELGPGQISVPDKVETAGKQIKVNGIAEMNLVAGQREQNFVFSNPEENPCYFEIEIVLRDTGEVLYTSKLLPPGYSISKFTLNRALDAGEYNVIVHFKTYSFDKEQRPLNNMDIKTIIKAS